ncbi:hypothetical protein [Spirosoma pomorum]
MQTELFPTTAAKAVPARTRKRRAIREPAERTILGHFVFDSWVSYPARTVNADDGLRVEFSVPVHSDLLEAVNNPDKRELLCKYRVRKGFKWGELGRMAEVHIEADLSKGPKGGMYLHCKSVEILKPAAIGGPKLSRSLMKKLEKKAMSKQPAVC